MLITLPTGPYKLAISPFGAQLNKAQLGYRSSKSVHYVAEPTRVGKAFQNDTQSF